MVGEGPGHWGPDFLREQGLLPRSGKSCGLTLVFQHGEPRGPGRRASPTKVSSGDYGPQLRVTQTTLTLGFDFGYLGVRAQTSRAL